MTVAFATPVTRTVARMLMPSVRHFRTGTRLCVGRMFILPILC